MNKSLTKAAAIAAITAGALLAVPAAASAAPYTPPADGEVNDSTITPGQSFSFWVDMDVFAPGEPVSISLTGENASGATLAAVKFAVQTNTLGTRTATAAGALAPVSITLPADASGSYTILATSPSNPVGVSAVVTVAAAAGGGAGDPGDGLAVTGLDSGATLTLWVAGGALVLAGGGLAVAGAVRRNKREAAA